MENHEAKFLCSYGGEIQPRTHDNKLSYVGGDNKILYVDRSIKLPAMLADLSALFDGAGDISFKYQLPGQDLDALISVTNDNDLRNMMREYDKLYRPSAKPPRMRLFLFPNNHLNPDPTSPEPDPVKANSKVDSLLGLDNGAAVPPPPAAVKLAPPPEYQPRVLVNASDLVVGSDPNVNHPLEVQKPLQRVVDCASSPFSCLFDSSTPGRYDVFLSFRGEDTRNNFTCHLHEALSRQRIKTFIDYELHKGDEISPSLVRAIEDSYVSVVVFSENYASSKWCLEELVKILECRKERGQIVIPVFYNVDPSHVRKQVGSYKKAFEKHLRSYIHDMKKIQKWKNALTEAAGLPGWDSQSCSNRDNSGLIQNIVEDVLQKLNYHYPVIDCIKGLVGTHKNSAPLESLLREARSVGIWGMGGIGKTTMARIIFEKYSCQYEGSCFLENVRERSGKYGQELHDLRNQLHSELLKEIICQNSTAESTFVECRLCKQRNLIVLDDVSSSKQLVYLIGELQSHGRDSKIIITTRDKSLLENGRVEKIYEVKRLDSRESLELFSLNAFNKDSPEMGYAELSQKAVVYCKGIPLALKVLGSFLYCKSETKWDSALKKLEKIPDVAIQNVLRLSYDGLNYEEKNLFLDIACFFKGKLKEYVVKILDNCGFCTSIIMRSLLDKALITISDNSVKMHDLIEQMGREIVCQESPESPENRSRLWSSDDICDVLINNKGTDAIESIMLDVSQSKGNLCLNADTFSRMPKLRLLKVVISSNTHGKLCDLQLPMGLKSLSDELRYLEWHEFPLQSLPSNFCPQELVSLRMPNSQFKRLWDGVQNIVNLKEVNLTECQELVELPDFSKAKNLKSVNLSNCRSLYRVHPSILSLGKLERLNLFNCKRLEMLESKIHSRSLKHLYVDGCLSLMKFALSSEEIERLDLSQTGVKVLHSSIGRFSKVKEIFLNGLRLDNLPNGLSCLKSLEKLSLENCHNLCELPHNVSHLSSLRKLLLDGSHVETLPESIKDLPNLKTLSLRGCAMLQSIPELPSSIRHLKALNCTLLQTVSFWLITSGLQEKKRINISFQNCGNLDVERCIYSFLQYVRELAYRCELRRRGGKENRIVWRSDFFKICYPDCRVPEWFTYRTTGASITFEVAPPSNYYFSSLLCIVLSSYSLDYELDIKCRCYLEDGNMHKYSFGISFLNHIPAKGNSDHVCMAYNYGGIFDVIKLDRLSNQIASSGYNPKVTFEFFVSRGVIGWNQDDNLLIKECGVYPLNAPDYCIKQMGLELA